MSNPSLEMWDRDCRLLHAVLHFVFIPSCSCLQLSRRNWGSPAGSQWGRSHQAILMAGSQWREQGKDPPPQIVWDPRRRELRKWHTPPIRNPGPHGCGDECHLWGGLRLRWCSCTHPHDPFPLGLQQKISLQFLSSLFLSWSQVSPGQFLSWRCLCLL